MVEHNLLRDEQVFWEKPIKEPAIILQTSVISPSHHIWRWLLPEKTKTEVLRIPFRAGKMVLFATFVDQCPHLTSFWLLATNLVSITLGQFWSWAWANIKTHVNVLRSMSSLRIHLLSVKYEHFASLRQSMYHPGRIIPIKYRLKITPLEGSCHQQFTYCFKHVSVTKKQ
jgi:hypothetical protein